MDDPLMGLLETGDPAIDAEHAYLLPMIREIESATQEGPARERLGALLARFIEETDVHFVSEELLMRQRGSPGLDAHAAEHDRLLAELRSIESRVRAAPADPDAELATFLLETFASHIQLFDRTLAAG